MQAVGILAAVFLIRRVESSLSGENSCWQQAAVRSVDGQKVPARIAAAAARSRAVQPGTKRLAAEMLPGRYLPARGLLTP